jgi:hypothetical protein
MNTPAILSACGGAVVGISVITIMNSQASTAPVVSLAVLGALIILVNVFEFGNS